MTSFLSQRMELKVKLAVVCLVICSTCFGQSITGNGSPVNPNASTPICHASYYGNDAYSGISWATPKADLMACYDALPASGGTIKFADSGLGNSHPIPACKATDPAGCGIQIGGPNDPNYASFGAPGAYLGWRKAKPVIFSGEGGSCYSQQSHSPTVCVAAGDSTHPGIWLSSATMPIKFENIELNFQNIQAQIGIDSDGGNTALSGWIGLWFKNAYFNNCNSCAGTNGPGVLIGGGNSFDIYIDDSVIGGNPNATPGSDNQAAILIKSAGTVGSADGLIYINKTVLTGGEVKVYGGANPASIDINNTYSESINGGSVSPCVGTVWIASSMVQAHINGFATADSSGNVCDVRNDATNQDPAWVTVSGNMNTQGAYLQGPMQFLTDISPSTVSPLRSGQEGFDHNRVVGFSGNSQRQFGLYGVAYANLVSASSASWSLGGSGGSFTIGIAAPDGTSNAVQLNGSATATARFYSNASAPWNLNDYWIASEWVRGPTSYSNPALSLIASINGGNSFTCTSLNPAYTGDGEWWYKSQICKVTLAGTGTNWVIMSEGLTGTSLQVYAPTLIRIPAGTVSDNEAYEIWNNLSSYDASCPIGSVCGIAGKPLANSSTILLPTAFTASPPTCSTSVNYGASYFITDASTTTYGATVTGGGSGKVKVLCNGTNWVVD